MFSLSCIPARASRWSLSTQSLRTFSTTSTPLRITLLRHPTTPPSLLSRTRLPLFQPRQHRTYASKSSADALIEEIQEQYATARDEFEIATEETEKKSVYGADDRAAAREELDKLKEMYGKALEGNDGEEVKRRVGQRIRELDNAIEALEESALED